MTNSYFLLLQSWPRVSRAAVVWLGLQTTYCVTCTLGRRCRLSLANAHLLVHQVHDRSVSSPVDCWKHLLLLSTPSDFCLVTLKDQEPLLSITFCKMYCIADSLYLLDWRKRRTMLLLVIMHIHITALRTLNIKGVLTYNVMIVLQFEHRLANQFIVCCLYFCLIAQSLNYKQMFKSCMACIFVWKNNQGEWTNLTLTSTSGQISVDANVNKMKTCICLFCLCFSFFLLLHHLSFCCLLYPPPRRSCFGLVCLFGCQHALHFKSCIWWSNAILKRWRI